jgi:dTDP-glucose pyrophosphorylase
VGELRPKPLIPVFDLPMIIWVMANFKLTPEDKIWIVSQSRDELPSRLSQYLSRFRQNIEFIELDKPTDGAAISIKFALDKIDDSEPIIVANSDQYIFADTGEFVDSVRKQFSHGQILTMKATSNAWSYVGRDDLGFITEIVEKIEISNEATVGVYGWSKAEYAKSAIEHMISQNLRTNNEFYIAPTYNFMIRNGQSIVTKMIGSHGSEVFGLGTPEDLHRFIQLPVSYKESLTIRKRLNI